MKPIWKNHEGEKYCKFCWGSIKAQDIPIPKKRKPLAPKSKKQTELDASYSKLRIIFLTKHPMCQAALPGCQGSSSDVHHMNGRGKNLLVISTWLSSCRKCHMWIHEHPEEARELNLLV